jgi:hypothetical protein
MRSFIALVVVVVLACTAVPALAVPTENSRPTAAHVERAAPPAPADDGGTAVVVYLLIGVGGGLALAGGGYLGARTVAARHLRPRAS